MPRFKIIEGYLRKRAKNAKIDWECDPNNPVLELKAHDARVKYLQHCRRNKLIPKDL